jgi:lipopolysaccharide export system protein LptA
MVGLFRFMDNKYRRRPRLGRQVGFWVLGVMVMGATTTAYLQPAIAQARRQGQNQGQTQALTLRSDIQEANSITGVITARGNVQIDYPARQIQATSAEAQYYSREQRIILSGDVFVLQEGNSLRGEVVTYLIEEGRFVAEPDVGQQVQSIYLVPDTATPAATAPAGPPPEAFNPKPEFKTPLSP